jgi:hypothetical protein
MYEKIYALISKWEEKWQFLHEQIASAKKEPDSELHVHFLVTKASELEGCINELTALVSE